MHWFSLAKTLQLELVHGLFKDNKIRNHLAEVNKTVSVSNRQKEGKFRYFFSSQFFRIWWFFAKLLLPIREGHQQSSESSANKKGTCFLAYGSVEQSFLKFCRMSCSLANLIPSRYEWFRNVSEKNDLMHELIILGLPAKICERTKLVSLVLHHECRHAKHVSSFNGYKIIWP